MRDFIAGQVLVSRGAASTPRTAWLAASYVCGALVLVLTRQVGRSPNPGNGR